MNYNRLIRLTLVGCMLLGAQAQCYSPRSECEASLPAIDTCSLVLTSIDRCQGREAMGQIPDGICIEAALLVCLQTQEEREACSKKSNIPLIPKIF
jgi:hypothetical protein